MRRAHRGTGWPFAAPLGRGEWRSGSNGRRSAGQVDPWGVDGEAFPGAGALEDVTRGLPAGEAAARLAVARLAIAAARGQVPGPMLEAERIAVERYVREAACAREEAAALSAAIALAVQGPASALASALCAAAAAALAGGCTGGAASLWRTAYAVAAPRRWDEEAADAAEELAALARAAGSKRGAALWRQRSDRHRRRGSAG